MNKEKIIKEVLIILTVIIILITLVLYIIFDKTPKELPREENQITEEKKEDNKEADKYLDEVFLSEVTKEENKVNIYFFHGAECPHCEAEIEMFERIKDEYGQYYNIYEYEVWHDTYNNKLMYTFAKAMGDKLRGVPYTIIGEKSFKGFNSNIEKSIIEAITTEYQKDFDIYFDKLKSS